MRKCARAGASANSGFTLVEVVLAIAILGAAATMILTSYIHSISQAEAAKDLTIASSIARNAVTEGYVKYTKEAKDVTYVLRPSLVVSLEEPVAKDTYPLTNLVRATVRDKQTGQNVVSYTMKRASYEMPDNLGTLEDDTAGGDADRNAAGGTDNASDESSINDNGPTGDETSD